MGTGIQWIRLALEEVKVPQVQYDLMLYFVRAVFPRVDEGLEKTTQEKHKKSRVGEK